MATERLQRRSRMPSTTRAYSKLMNVLDFPRYCQYKGYIEHTVSFFVS